MPGWGSRGFEEGLRGGCRGLGRCKTALFTASFREPAHWKHGPIPWSLELLKGHFEVQTCRFEFVRSEHMSVLAAAVGLEAKGNKLCGHCRPTRGGPSVSKPRMQSLTGPDQTPRLKSSAEFGVRARAFVHFRPLGGCDCHRRPRGVRIWCRDNGQSSQVPVKRLQPSVGRRAARGQQPEGPGSGTCSGTFQGDGHDTS